MRATDDENKFGNGKDAYLKAKSFYNPDNQRYFCSMLKHTLLKAVQTGAAVMQSYFNGTFEITNKEAVFILLFC